eukprot:TRINITY_DN5839_c0_g1_i1.p1 TRINITY_DN5839_c0_g1~~TRINITY_DN5839_c0_g1_i1.p1  ORF type:complete len:748 (+),score=181.18 TRINITY_DN5839_c0_g1_i1:186-2429(+)
MLCEAEGAEELEGEDPRAEFLRTCHKLALQQYKHHLKDRPRQPPWSASNVPWGSKKTPDKTFIADRDKYLKVSGEISLDILGALWVARDQCARSKDVYSVRVLSHYKLIRIAAESENVPEALAMFERMKLPAISRQPAARTAVRTVKPAAAGGSPAEPVRVAEASQPAQNTTVCSVETAVGGALGEAVSSAGSWVCKCPKEGCGRVLLEGVELCLSAQDELMTVDPLNSSLQHGFEFLPKPAASKKPNDSHNATCKECGTDVGNGRFFHAGAVFPVLRHGKKGTTTQVRFKRKGVPHDEAVVAKDWAKRHQAQLRCSYETAKQSGNFSQHKKLKMDHFKETTVLIRVNTPAGEPAPEHTHPQLRVDEWFSETGAQGSAWLGLSHCTSSMMHEQVTSAHKQAALEAPERLWTPQDTKRCWRVFAVQSANEAKLLMLLKGATKRPSCAGVVPRGLIQEIPDDVLDELRRFTQSVCLLDGKFQLGENQKAMLLPCSDQMASALWDWAGDSTRHLWCTAAVAGMAAYCRQLLTVMDPQPVAPSGGWVLQAAHNQYRYLFKSVRTDKSPLSTFQHEKLGEISYYDYAMRTNKARKLAEPTEEQPMWEVVSKVPGQQDTLLLPELTDVLCLPRRVVDAIHTAIPQILQAGGTYLDVRLNPKAEAHMFLEARQEWATQLDSLANRIPVLQKVEQCRIEEALSSCGYLNASYSNYERLEFLGDKVLEVIARACVVHALPNAAIHQKDSRDASRSS